MGDGAGPPPRWQRREDLTQSLVEARSHLWPECEPARAGASGINHQADPMRPVATIDLPRLLTFLPMVAASRAG
jgi:hypothetical protein